MTARMLDEVTEKVIGCAMIVHRELGPGLLESSYEACLAYELTDSGLDVQRQIELPIKYKNLSIGCGYRIDLLIEDKVIIELKAVERLMPIHQAQTLTYMKLANKPVGLLMNFNETMLKNGLKRLVNGN